MGWYCPGRFAQEADNICDWIQGNNDISCGDIGSYTINQSVKIPENIPKIWFSPLKVKLYFDGSDDDEECSLDASYQMSSPTYLVSMSLLGMALAATAVFFVDRRTRTIVKENENSSPFVELTDEPHLGEGKTIV